jgi:Tol biopolymer transport system component/mono/diheme cytochrome c family protein
MRSWHVFAIVVLLIAVVGLGGWLIGRNSRPLATGVAQTAAAGDLRVTLRIDDTTVGTRVIDVTVADAEGQPADVSDLRLRFSMRDMNMGLSEIQAQPVGRGHFQARGQFFSMVGNWAVEAVLMRENGASIQVPFTMAIAGPGEMSGPINPLAVNAETIQEGQKLYAANCAACHGSTGKGDGPAAAGLNPRPADFTQHMGPGKHTDGQIYLWIKNGFPNSAMPAWDQRLSEQQIWQLVSYLRTFNATTVATNATAQPNPTGAQPQPQAAPNQPVQVPLAQEPLPPIIFARQSNIWRSDGKGGAPQQITSLTAGSYAEYPTFSPDGSQIAFVAITPAPVTATLPLPTSALYVMNADGSALKPVWKPAQGLLGLFAWAPDGKSIYANGNGVQAETTDANSGRQLQVVRLDVATGAIQPLLTDALDPTLSRDGKQLAYLKLSADGYTMSLTIAAPDGSNAREIISGTDFQGFYAPRFSPDGKQIIVAGIGGPETDQQGNPIKASLPSALDRLLGLFEPATAEAHGLPWDLWVVNTDGTGLRRLTYLSEDLPMVAFSPDGKQVAIMGLGGIYLMAPDGSQLRKIDAVGDHGGLDWAR